MTVRTAIVDDHAMLRSSLAQLLGNVPDIEVAGVFRDGEAALAGVPECGAQVVLMDIAMPGIGGIEATRQLTAENPGLRVIMLTSFADRQLVVEALSAGATGYLLKDAEPGDLVRAIHAARAGDSALAPRVATTLVAELRGRRDALSNTTPREREVLGCLVAGLSNKQIARRMSIAEKTVKAHLTNTFTKIGVLDRTQAALWAVEHGITPLSESARPRLAG